MATNTDPPLAKRPKTDDATTAITAPSTSTTSSTIAAALPQSAPQSPRSIVTWNCNGFVTRCKYNVPELQKLLEKTNIPDMICIQEARLKAQSPSCRGTPMSSEFNGPVETALNTIFQDYVPYWSLADTRYAGTLTLLHKRMMIRNVNVQVAYTVDSAIDVLLKHYDLTRDTVGLLLKVICTQQQNTASSTSKPVQQPQQQQKSISSFFKVTAAASNKPSNKRPRSLGQQQQQQQRHHAEGRFQFFLFPGKDIIQTYVPNHGMKMEKWDKRKEWDLEVLQFVQQRQQILEYASNNKKTSTIHNNHHRTLLWCGDLNVAHKYMDGTHWENRSVQTTTTPATAAAAAKGPHDLFYEWWRDEPKCIIDKKHKHIPKAPEYVGMPSFTLAERTRFKCFLKKGRLVDVWREKHPDPCQNWNAPHWTWRGLGPVYGNKGQRLDYFLLSKEDMERVESCRILGTGNRKGLFCGSDHCVSMLVLKEAATAAASTAVEEEEEDAGAKSS